MSCDPLRGNLFENLVVIDLLVAVGPHIFPFEIKAGATISEDYFKGLRSFARNVASLSLGSGLVYGGDEMQLRSGTRIYPATGIHDLLESLEGKQ